MSDSYEVASEGAIFGSGALTYPHWIAWERAFPWVLDDQENPPENWAYKITAQNRCGEEPVTAFVTHASLMASMHAIMHPTEPWGVEAGLTTRLECRAFLYDPEQADFDADTADEVLQVAVFGGVFF